MSAPIPSPRIGSFAAMSLDVEHIRVRASEADIFRGVVCAREALTAADITRFVAPSRSAASLCEELLNLGLDAAIELRNASPDRAKAIQRLELAAAMAITTIEALHKES